MYRNVFICMCVTVALFIGPFQAPGALTADQLARLDKDLTPSGAIKAGNEEGTIPAWEGGLTTPPPNYVPGERHVDPYPEDKPLFTINAGNIDRHGDKLTDSHKAMLKSYGTFYMNVYPTRRSWAAPQWIYDATKKTAAVAKLTDSGNGVETGGPVNGYPFPIPGEALEILWNHILRWRSTGIKNRPFVISAVTRSGDFVLTKSVDRIIINWDIPGQTEKNLNNVIWYYRQETLAPPRMAGRVLLLYETLNQYREPRKAFLYNPGSRRVRRAPEYGFDNPYEGSDGLMTVDQNDMFNGSPERYDWKLIGKKEMYIPYNAYRLNSCDLKYKEILTPMHLNPKHLRYELHRVWIVEGTLKEKARHLYKRRVFYIDEDSYSACVIDNYDNRNQLWRVDEGHMVAYYDVPTSWWSWEAHYDLQLGRYATTWGNNEEKNIAPWSTPPDQNMYNPGALRRTGMR